MQRILNLSSRKIRWNDLRGKKILNENIRLSDYGDIYPFQNHVIFKNAKRLIVDNCDKNFVYYWIDKVVFPNLETLYLVSHPCESAVLNRQIKTIFLHERYRRYKDRWSRRNNITIVPEDFFVGLLNTFEDEDMAIE